MKDHSCSFSTLNSRRIPPEWGLAPSVPFGNEPIWCGGIVVGGIIIGTLSVSDGMRFVEGSNLLVSRLTLVFCSLDRIFSPLMFFSLREFPGMIVACLGRCLGTLRREFGVWRVELLSVILDECHEAFDGMEKFSLRHDCPPVKCNEEAIEKLMSVLFFRGFRKIFLDAGLATVGSVQFLPQTEPN